MSYEFGPLRESLINDMFICDLNKNILNNKQCLIKEDDLTLEKALKITSTTILSQQRIKQLDDNYESK